VNAYRVLSIHDNVRLSAWTTSILVMPGPVPGIHVFLSMRDKDVDGRDKPGHDEK
jgi:hypothetical protein